jgi:hypothetical protein
MQHQPSECVCTVPPLRVLLTVRPHGVPTGKLTAKELMAEMTRLAQESKSRAHRFDEAKNALIAAREPAEQAQTQAVAMMRVG